MKQKQPPRPHEDEDDDERIHELVDIVAEEVSDVDHAANRHTYLVIKRDDEFGPALLESDDGALSLLTAADDDDAFVLFDFDKAKAEAGPDDAPAPATAHRLVLTPRAKALLLQYTTAALDRLTTLVTSIQAADERDGAPVPTAVGYTLRQVCEPLNALIVRSPTGKASAKMATQRRRQLESAIELLQKLLGEVMPRVADAGGQRAAEPAAQADEPTPDTGGEAARQRTDKSDPGDQDDAASENADIHLAQILRTMAQGIAALTERARKQEAALTKLAKSTGLPASREVEAAPTPTRHAKEDWPFDMNAPVSRDRVPQEISFFDD